MAMETISRLFNNEERTKLLRFFIFNSEGIFDSSFVAKKTKINTRRLNRELKDLKKLDFIHQNKVAGKAKKGWQLNAQYPFERQLRKLFNAEIIQNRNRIIDKFKNCGKLKTLLVSGVFLEEAVDNVDLVIIGDNLKKAKIETAIRGLEEEIGKEIVYAIFGVDDFMYRLHSGDRFVRNVLDYPHIFVVNKLGL